MLDQNEAVREAQSRTTLTRALAKEEKELGDHKEGALMLTVFREHATTQSTDFIASSQERCPFVCLVQLANSNTAVWWK